MLPTLGAFAALLVAASATTPPSSSSPVPSPTPFYPFRDECFNQKCMSNRNYTDLASFCPAAKNDHLLYYCIQKGCYVNQEIYEAAIDEACANLPDHLHPFKNECLNQCVDQQPGKYTDMKYFCAWARIDPTLKACSWSRCHESWYDYQVDAVCGPVSVTTTPTLTPSTTPPPYSPTVSSSHPCWNKTLCSRPPHSTGSHGHPITITETSTHIETLTYCPHHHTCTGQTTTWTFTEGPTSCPPTTTCTCVLPSETIPTVEASPTTTGVTEFQGVAAKAGAGLVAALVGVVAVL